MRSVAPKGMSDCRALLRGYNSNTHDTFDRLGVGIFDAHCPRLPFSLVCLNTSIRTRRLGVSVSPHPERSRWDVTLEHWQMTHRSSLCLRVPLEAGI